MSIIKLPLRVIACLEHRGGSLLKKYKVQSAYKLHQFGLQFIVKKDWHSGRATKSSHLSDPENKGERQKGINFDTLGSWNSRIEMTIDIEKSIQKGSLIPEIPLDDVGTASLLGRRKVNEDRFSIEQISDDLLYFAIFDGHGGATAVDFVQAYIQHHISHWLSRTTDLSEVLRNSFIDVNNLLTRHLFFFNDVSNGSTGTTATVCLLRNNIELVIGHVGDSRAILCRECEALRLSHDHTPDDPEECGRIKKAGGTITENSLGVPHVNGRLTMTRSIGDIELKAFGVTAEPHIRSIRVSHGRDSFLILTTDGVSFVLSDQELMDIVTSCRTPTEAAKFVTDQALQFGSEDNSTAVVIPFGAWGKYQNTTRSIPYSFGRNLSSNRYR
ncbi:protein phosphatase 1K, mitochondrial-like [Mercenaria mercenaria]|uniref:protein phosphatase 1K, mitochondrial-like n=1 Tax=Mercenaria mercenaria TaxID=6596 RepID=UPI001E1DAF30|nr:protein phosphatase 1K, mitochondrial-like [Mercenaria mercenaria]XP_053399740.1 protein phosphatase 1K, mitochondrial-like [Mercenaria mercenaria]